MHARAAERVCELRMALAKEEAHLARCNSALAAMSPPVPKARACNMHDDCDAADAKWQVRDGKRAAHCHSDDCEDCFGT